MVQFVYNNTVSDITGFLSLYLNYGFKPDIYYQLELDKSLSQTAQLKVDQLKGLHEQLMQDIQFIVYRIAKYYNNGRLLELIFKRGKKVFLI